jgi:tetratricopeptide (TPR) repeat protein
MEEQGQTGVLSSFVAELGHSQCALGRQDEAEPLAHRARDLANEQDVWSQAMWRQVMALVLAYRGGHAEAVRLAREAVAILEPTDSLTEQGQALVDLAEVLAAAGRSDEARECLEQALDRYERKKNLVMAGRVREKLATTAARR